MINPRAVQVVNKCKIIGDGSCPCKSTCYLTKFLDSELTKALQRNDFETTAFLQEKLSEIMREFENVD